MDHLLYLISLFSDVTDRPGVLNAQRAIDQGFISGRYPPDAIVVGRLSVRERNATDFLPPQQRVVVSRENGEYIQEDAAHFVDGMMVNYDDDCVVTRYTPGNGLWEPKSDPNYGVAPCQHCGRFGYAAAE